VSKHLSHWLRGPFLLARAFVPLSVFDPLIKNSFVRRQNGSDIQGWVWEVKDTVCFAAVFSAEMPTIRGPLLRAWGERRSPSADRKLDGSSLPII